MAINRSKYITNNRSMYRLSLIIDQYTSLLINKYITINKAIYCKYS